MKEGMEVLKRIDAKAEIEEVKSVRKDEGRGKQMTHVKLKKQGR